MKDIKEQAGIIPAKKMVHSGFDAPVIKDLGGKHGGLGKKSKPPFAICFNSPLIPSRHIDARGSGREAGRSSRIRC